MRDPDLVLRAQQAAAALERAWHRWSAIHGMGADPQPPVSSYVGYSLEEPWGQPRVVFGVNAEEAEQLAAILDGHDCVRLIEAAASAMHGGGQAGVSGGRDWPAEAGRVHVPAQAPASSGQRPLAGRPAQSVPRSGLPDPLALADAPTEFDWAALGSPGAPPWAVGVIDDEVLRESPLFRQAAAARRAAQVREAAERQTAHWESARWEEAARAAAERDGAARLAAVREYGSVAADGRGPDGRAGDATNGEAARRLGLPSAADQVWAQYPVPGLAPPAGIDRAPGAAAPEPPSGPALGGQRRPVAAGWPDPLEPPVSAAWQTPPGSPGSRPPTGSAGWPASPAAPQAGAGAAAGWPAAPPPAAGDAAGWPVPPAPAAGGAAGWPAAPPAPPAAPASPVSAARAALEALSAAADRTLPSAPSRSGRPCPPHYAGREPDVTGAQPQDGNGGRNGTEQLQGLPPYQGAEAEPGGAGFHPAPVAGSAPGRPPSRRDPVTSTAFQPGAALSAYLDQGPDAGPFAERQHPAGAADGTRPGGIVRGRSMPRLPWSRRNGAPADHDGAEAGPVTPHEPLPGGNGGGRNGNFPASADAAGWTSGELPGQAAHGDTAW